MYYNHFGLKEPPFKITPNTEFFFNGSNRGAVLDALVYAITNGEGIIKVVGEVGSGKTMICRMLQTVLPAQVECIYLANPSVAPEDILHAIAFELGLKLPKNAERLKVMQVLQGYLLDRHEAGKRVVIFVEEAQGMPLATLEEIRLLSNLETKHEKLLQMVLFGQPELDINLNQAHIRQLRERITHSFNLTPLQPNEVGDYLIFRLRSAGYFGPHLFSPKAIVRIAKAAKGLVRRINILADKALLAAFADNVYLVTPKHVKAAIADSEFGADLTRAKSRRLILVGLILVLLLGLALGYIAQRFYQPGYLSAWWPAWQHAQAKSVQQPKAAKPTAHAVAPVIQQPALAEEVAPVAATVQVASSVLVRPELSKLQSRLEATEQWLTLHSLETISIQILGTSDVEQLTRQLDALTQKIELDNLYVYQTELNQSPYYTVLYGTYSDRNSASVALKKLPLSLQKYQPHLRTIGGILDETHKTQ